MSKLRKLIPSSFKDLLVIGILVLLIVATIMSWFDGDGIDFNSEAQRKVDMFQR